MPNADILQGRPVARGSFFLMDTVVIGDADQARAMLVKGSEEVGLSTPPHMLSVLGRESGEKAGMETLQRPHIFE